MSAPDAAEISGMLADRIENLCAELLPNGREESGSWRVGSLDGEPGSSLSVKLRGKPGMWHDFATGEKGDALDLVKAVVARGDMAEALKWSREWLGVGSSTDARQRPSRNSKPHIAAATVKAAPEPPQGEEEARSAKARKRWSEGIDPRGTLVEKYLNSRCLELTGDIAGTVIRFHPARPWRDDDGAMIRIPAMICAMRSILTDELTAVHRTRLSPEGLKLDRRMLGVAAGSAIKLDADDVTNGLHICEGVESGLAARALGFKPTWSLGSAGGIADFPVLDGLECLTILVENDASSERAAAACTRRWQAAGREVLHARSLFGSDANDALRRKVLQ